MMPHWSLDAWIFGVGLFLIFGGWIVPGAIWDAFASRRRQSAPGDQYPLESTD